MAEGSERKKAASKASPEQRHKRVGTSIRGKYRVDAFLATGTMANVYAATHRNGARVALKILHKQLAEDPSLCDRFKREGYFANSIGHPGIVRAIDDDLTEDGCPFLVMELLEGETLEERRRRKGGRLPCSWLLPIADSLLEILSAAHAREVVHRDMKPDNVFVTKDGDVKVLDFGVARWNDAKSSSDMTAVGMVLGTPAYMPPEQALGRREEVDAQSDIWAVGATLFVVLSGESVHVGGDAKAKLIATARTAARPLREAAPDVPRSVAAVIDRALAFHKSERWPDAEAMREALRWARMSLEERPSQQAAVASASSQRPPPEPPPPVETRRNMHDDEPTIARAFPRDGDSSAPDATPSAGVPVSRDFLTSAPPVTLRDMPRSTGIEPSSMGPVFSLNNEPIFSLRREKENGEDSRSPSTERFPRPDPPTPAAGTPATPHASPNARLSSSSAKTAPGIGDVSSAPPVSPVSAPVMASYDPSAPDAMGLSPPSSSEDVQPVPSVDISLSFTRPMAAIVMPADWPAPRPAAGAPADPAAYAATFPEPYPQSPQSPQSPPSPDAYRGGTMPGMYPSGPPPHSPHAPSAPPEMHASGPQVVMTESAQHLAQPETVPSLRPSLTPREAPGPLLSSIVKPSGGRFMRVVVPLLLACVAVAAVFMALRIRAANARARASAVSAPSGVGVVSTVGSATPTTASTAVTPPGNALPEPPARAATVAPAPVAAGASTEPKKKKRPRRPAAAAKPIEPTEPATPTEPAAPAVTTPPPVDTTPKDSLPTKDPEPKPAPPVDTGVN